MQVFTLSVLRCKDGGERMKISYLFAIFILILSSIIELAMMYRIITKLEKLVHELEERKKEDSNA